MQQVQLEKTLDVEVVERQLGELWQQTAGHRDTGDDAAVLRARVANLLVFVPRESQLNEVDQMIPDLTSVHPSRVLMMLGRKDAPDRDIEMYVAAFCQSDKRTGVRRLCCEEVTLKAQGRFVAELPSAALPLLVADLSTFFWWRDALQLSDKVFDALLRAADRLVIDSAEFENSKRDLAGLNKLFTHEDYKHLGISDLNWARLTLWRGLLADFYDVPAYQSLLDQVNKVRVDYVAPDREPAAVAPQALFIAGWLASRLGWAFVTEHRSDNDDAGSFEFADRNKQPIRLQLNRVAQGERKPGRLVQVELKSDHKLPVSFTVTRSADNLHIRAEARLGPDVQRGRVLPVRNRSATQLLGREMEILCNDQIYQEAVAVATRLVRIE